MAQVLSLEKQPQNYSQEKVKLTTSGKQTIYIDFMYIHLYTLIHIHTYTHAHHTLPIYIYASHLYMIFFTSN